MTTPNWPITHLRAAVAAAALLLAPAAAGRASAQAPGNLGFEETSATFSTRPAAWEVRTRGYGVLLDSVAPHTGKYGLKAEFAPGASPPPAYASASQALVPIAAARGKRVRVSGWIRTENVAGGRAALWVRVGGSNSRGPALAFEAGRGPTGTTPWTRYHAEARVDSTATSVTFGVQLEGGGDRLVR